MATPTLSNSTRTPPRVPSAPQTARPTAASPHVPVASQAPASATSPGYSGKSSFTPAPSTASPSALGKPSGAGATSGAVAGTGSDFEARKAQYALKVDAATDPQKYDGMYIGGDGYAYPPDKFKASEVPPFRPQNVTSQPTKTTYYVNGVLTWPTSGDHSFGDPTGIQADAEAQKIANTTGTNVVLVYNATSGNPVNDFAQTEGDRLGVGEDKAAQTLSDAIYSDLKAGRNVDVAGYSQGGAIVGRALNDVNNRIYNDQGGFLGNLPPWGWQKQAEREAMLSHVNVNVFAGAGANFPDGPRYNFYVNSEDPVPNSLGVHDPDFKYDGTRGALDGLLGLTGAILDGPHHEGAGTRIHTFDEPGVPGADLLSAEGVHGLQWYLNHYQP